ncbi:MAG: hypothetical protein ACK55I_19960, partial [bacterium]
MQTALAKHLQVTVSSLRVADEADASQCNLGSRLPEELRVDARAERPLAPLEAFLSAEPRRVLLAADSPGRREVLNDLLRGAGLR